MKSQNLYVKSAKVQKCKTCGNYKVIRLKKKMKNNCRKVCSIQEKSVPLQQSCKKDIKQQNLRHNYGESFS